MDAVKFLIEAVRMCKTIRFCKECPFGINGKEKATFPCKSFPTNLDMANPEEAVAIVEKWSAKHPVKTRQSEFLKMFPNAKIENGVLSICPTFIDVKCGSVCSDTKCGSSCQVSCNICRKNYWLAEVE